MQLMEGCVGRHWVIHHRGSLGPAATSLGALRAGGWGGGGGNLSISLPLRIKSEVRRVCRAPAVQVALWK